jgi:glycerophosphoryl diester phosphodiesterase
MKHPFFILLALSGASLTAAPTVWNFENTADRLAASSGTAEMTYYDVLADDWGPTLTTFDSASALGLPLINGADSQVMSYPATFPEQGYQVTHDFDANGSLIELGLVSNYTVVMDVLYPAESDGQWRNLMQTDPFNSSDGEVFVTAAASGGFGIGGNYLGRVEPDRWHRIVWVMRAAEGEGQAHRYIDGEFVGAIGTTGTGLGDRWALQDTFLFFADENNETAAGFVSSISIVDRKMTEAEIRALGGPNAAGANVPGAAAAMTEPAISRPVKILGHRGSSGCAPENTLAAISQSFTDGASGTEIDTRITSDGVVIAFHDATLDRTTDGTGDVAFKTLAEIQALDAGSWFSPDFVGEKVPTLEEVLTEAKGKGIIYLDIKTEGQADGFADAVTNSDFPLEDLWFWTPGNRAYAAEIRAAIPGAQIVWGNPDGDWASNPDYFTELRDLGVIGFSYGQGGANARFSAAAKAEGMFVEVYTLLNPGQLAAAAAAGVDYVETDFPEFMLTLQPEQTIAASGPSLVDGSMDVAGEPVLSWIPGLGATAHLVSFGTTNPPAFIGEQDFDLYQTQDLEPATTYYWRINTVADDTIALGPIWSFTTLAAPAEGVVHEWHLDGDLASAAGDAILGFSAGALTSSEVTFETSDGATVPHMANGPTDYLRIPAFFDPTQGLDLTFVTTEPTEGGDDINSYTFVFDILVPEAMNWMPFFNTDPTNSTDSDFFLRAGGGMGIGALGYADDGTIPEGEWKRVIFSADLANGLVDYYVDGTRVLQRTGQSLAAGRFSLFDSADAAPQVRLFNDNDGETTEVLVGAIAFVNEPLSADAAAELGGADARGIFFPASGVIDLQLAIDPTTDAVVLTWNAGSSALFSVEASDDLMTWSELEDSISGEDGTANYRHEALDRPEGSALFYRVVKQ